MHKKYEIRCPVYGFVSLNNWEREIINHKYFQRLRRIRQLAWTDYVYPGAMHTRFEHSLGVMHMASLLYDGIVQRSSELLHEEMGYNEDGLGRNRVLIRLAALLHDVGHAPFSHVSEELLPSQDGGEETYKHESYSAQIVRMYFTNIIENHPLNKNYDFKANDVAGLLEGSQDAGSALFWRDLISGQMDADRMDYLLRDSLHAGVDYGRYDWQRLVHTIEAVPGPENESPRLGVSEGGWHAAEGLIVARYFMFTQVYFHKTRVAYDYHLKNALLEMLPDGKFPPPTKEEDLEKYMKWDDWCVLGELIKGNGGEHGKVLRQRNHYRLAWETPETPKEIDFEKLSSRREALENFRVIEAEADKSWYKIGETDIPVVSESKEQKVAPLSKYSSFVDKIEPIRQMRLYVHPKDLNDAKKQLEKIRREK
ncbi:MAG: HD domain-containing protein [Deltaproteobacteria bacterium]|nr:HD domain-containing protein [Deltaproteobacteria bacterium]MBW2323456.1 HD domain-containing protein [Deltaproteobacteria bacterium]